MRQQLLRKDVRPGLTDSSIFSIRKSHYRSVTGSTTYSTTHAINQSQSTSSALAMSGGKFFPDTPLQLLPLLQPVEQCRTTPATDRLQRAERRLSFTTKDASSNEEVQWLSSTHVFPSAYPRSHSSCTAPSSSILPRVEPGRAPLVDKSEERRLREVDFATWEKMANLNSPESFYPPASRIDAQAKAEDIAGQGQPRLWNVVQKITPSREIKRDNSITLFLAHANGFHKELYEPTIKRVIDGLNAKGSRAPSIDEIWLLDTFNAGQSALLNRDHLGGAVSWLDQNRDIQQFITTYLPPRGSSPGMMLERQDETFAKATHKLIGVGHSFSASGMIILCSLNPDIFDGAIFIDPVGVPQSDFFKLPMPAEIPLARGAIARKEVFPNRDVARQYMMSKPYFSAWDSEVLDLHIRHGLYSIEAEGAPVALCTSRWSEALAYSTTFMGSLSFRQVQRSKFQGWAHLICMRDTNFFYFGERGPEPLMVSFQKNFCGRASTEMLPGGHLVVQEQPGMLGTRLANVLMHHEEQPRGSRL